MRPRLLFLAGALVLLVVAGAQATTPYGRRAKARAERDAAKELAAVQLPRGAKRVGTDPSVHRVLGPPAVACVRKYVVDDRGFWRVSAKPAAVWSWMKQHRPAHYYWLGWGKLSDRGKPVEWDVQIGYRDQSNVTYRLLDVTIRAARGGGAAVRVDGVAVWLPRPKRPPCYTSY